MADSDKKRSLLDRRTCESMRKSINLNYFTDGGIERRKLTDRRHPNERRSDWMRVSKWCSVSLEE